MEKELLKWRKKLFDKELFYKRKRKECLRQIHEIDKKLSSMSVKFCTTADK